MVFYAVVFLLSLDCPVIVLPLVWDDSEVSFHACQQSFDFAVHIIEVIYID